MKGGSLGAPSKGLTTANQNKRNFCAAYNLTFLNLLGSVFKLLSLIGNSVAEEMLSFK